MARSCHCRCLLSPKSEYMHACTYTITLECPRSGGVCTIHIRIRFFFVFCVMFVLFFSFLVSCDCFYTFFKRRISLLPLPLLLSFHFIPSIIPYAACGGGTTETSQVRIC